MAFLIATTPFCQLNGMQMAANHVAQVTLECSICFTDTNDGVRLSCGHAFCKGCLKRIVDNAVREKSTRNLVCPATNPRCARALSLEEVDVITDNDATIINWHASILDREALIREHGGQPCPGRPGRNCNAVLIRATPQEARITRCDECERNFCNACFLPADVHTGVNCARAQELYAQGNEATPEERATLALMRRNSKPCPRCNNAVEKVDGCNHMTCRCGHHFCWECRADWINYGHRCAAQVSQAQRTGWDAPAPAAVPSPVVPQPAFLPVQGPRAAAIPRAQPPAHQPLANNRELTELEHAIADLRQRNQIALDQAREARERARRAQEQAQRDLNRFNLERTLRMIPELQRAGRENPNGPRPDGGIDDVGPLAAPVGAALWMKFGGS